MRAQHKSVILWLVAFLALLLGSANCTSVEKGDTPELVPSGEESNHRNFRTEEVQSTDPHPSDPRISEPSPSVPQSPELELLDAPLNDDNAPEPLDDGAGEEQPLMRFSGILTSYGNAPRTYLALEVQGDQKGISYFVHPDYWETLGALTGELLVFSGHLYRGEERFFQAQYHQGVFVPIEWENTDQE